jgi:hypothetical protein
MSQPVVVVVACVAEVLPEEDAIQEAEEGEVVAARANPIHLNQTIDLCVSFATRYVIQ